MKLIEKLKTHVIHARLTFEDDVNRASSEITEVAQNISKAIGSDISVIEAKEFIAAEFRRRLMK